MLDRSLADLSARRLRWPDRVRRSLTGVSLIVENGQSRVQSAVTNPIHVRTLHDPWYGVSLVSLAGPDTSIYTVSLVPQVAPRDDVVDGVDVIDEDAASWTALSGYTPSIGTDELAGLKDWGPIVADRSDFDSEGVFDFMRLSVSITTSGVWQARDLVTVQLFGNQQLANLDAQSDRFRFKTAEISELQFPEVEL